MNRQTTLRLIVFFVAFALLSWFAFWLDGHYIRWQVGR